MGMFSDKNVTRTVNKDIDTSELFVNGQVITSIKQSDDSNILLDCVCESYDEMVNYMFSTCLNWCSSHDLKLVAFEIIAE